MSSTPSPKQKYINTQLIKKLFSFFPVEATKNYTEEDILETQKNENLSHYFYTSVNSPNILGLGVFPLFFHKKIQPLTLEEVLSFVGVNSFFFDSGLSIQSENTQFNSLKKPQYHTEYTEKIGFLLGGALPIGVLTLLALQEFSPTELRQKKFLENHYFYGINVFDILTQKKSIDYFKKYPSAPLTQDIFKIENLKTVFSYFHKNSLRANNLQSILDIITDPTLIKKENATELLFILLEKSNAFFSRPSNAEVFLNILLTKYQIKTEPLEAKLQELGYTTPTFKKALQPSDTQLFTLDVNLQEWVFQYPSLAETENMKEGYIAMLDSISRTLSPHMAQRFNKDILSLSPIQNFYNNTKKIVIEVRANTDIKEAQDIVQKLFHSIFSNYMTMLNQHLDTLTNAADYQKELLALCNSLDRAPNSQERLPKKERPLNRLVLTHLDKIELETVLTDTTTSGTQRNLAPNSSHKKFKL